MVADNEKVGEEIYKVADVLEDCAVLARYPADGFEPTIDDAKEAYVAAEIIKNSFEGKILEYVIQNYKTYQ